VKGSGSIKRGNFNPKGELAYEKQKGVQPLTVVGVVVLELGGKDPRATTNRSIAFERKRKGKEMGGSYQSGTPARA